MKTTRKALAVILFSYSMMYGLCCSWAGDSQYGVLDQQQNKGKPNRGVFDNAASTQSVVQSFVPTGQQLMAISIYISNLSSKGKNSKATAIASIYKADPSTHFPTGAVLGSQTLVYGALHVGWNTFAFNTPITVNPGKLYAMQFSIKNEAGTPHVGFDCCINTSGGYAVGRICEFNGSTYIPREKWDLMFKTYVGSSMKPASKSNDKSISTVAKRGKDVLQVYDFEDVKLERYILRSGCTASVSNKNPKEGRFFLKQCVMKGNRQNWNCISARETISVQPNTMYKLSVWSRNTLKDCKGKFGLREINAQGKTVDYNWHEVETGNNNWKQYSVTFLPNPMTQKLQLYLYIDNQWSNYDSQSGYIDWDDIRISEVPYPGKRGLTEKYPLSVTAETLCIEQTANGNNPEFIRVWIQAGAIGGNGTVSLALTLASFGNSKLNTAIWQKKERISNNQPKHYDIPAKDLALGRYTLSVKWISPDTNSFFIIKKPLAVIIPKWLLGKPEAIKKSSIDSDRQIILVNGKPFSSIYYSHAEGAVPELQKYGATTVVCHANNPERMKQIADYNYGVGLYSWVVLFSNPPFDKSKRKFDLDQLKKFVETMKDHPGVIGYNLIDEPEFFTTPDELKKAEQLIRKLDSKHVIWVNLAALRGAWPEWIGFGDLASYDDYPYPNLKKILESNENILKLSERRKPLLSYIQTYAGAGYSMPTPAWLRAELYAGICQGMTNFHYYSWYDPHPTRSLYSDPELRSFTRLLNHEVRQMKDFLFTGEELDISVRTLDEQGLVYRIKRLNDNKIKMVVVNPFAKPIGPLQIRLPKSRIVFAKVKFENDRKVKIKNGAIEDSFAPFEVHVYEIN